MRKGKDPYLWLTDPDAYPGGDKNIQIQIRIRNTNRTVAHMEKSKRDSLTSKYKIGTNDQKNICEAKSNFSLQVDEILE